jgi:hypothetical protein
VATITNFPGFNHLSVFAARTPSKSVVKGLSMPVLESIQQLFWGPTDQQEENEALAKFLSAPTANGLGFLIDGFTGAWNELNDELDPGPITQIAKRLSTLLDRRDYLPWRLVAGSFADSFVTTDRGPVVFVTQRTPLKRWHAMVNDLALRNLTAKAIGALPNLADTDRIATGELVALRAKLSPGADRDALDGVLATCEYTDRLVRNIVIPDGPSVLDAIADIAQETNAHRLAAAIDVMAQVRDTTLAALITAASPMGLGANQAALTRLHEVLEQADQIGNPLPGGINGVIQQALNVLSQLVANVQQDLDAFANSFQDVSSKLVNFSIVGSSADDIARSVVSQLRSNKTLSALPTQMKISMIRALLDADWTGDDDEQTILAILGDPANGARTQAEFFAMYGGVGHQDYQDNIDGQENDDMYALLKRMSFQRPNADPPH